jgi:YD repeat-containing protein
VFFTPLVAFVLLAVLHPASPRVEYELDASPITDAAFGVHGQRIELAVVLTIGVALALLVGFMSLAHAQQQTFRDASGRLTGTVTQSGNQTTFRDANGRTTGTATTDSGGTTVLRDVFGRTTGTINRK